MDLHPTSRRTLRPEREMGLFTYAAAMAAGVYATVWAIGLGIGLSVRVGDILGIHSEFALPLVLVPAVAIPIAAAYRLRRWYSSRAPRVTAEAADPATEARVAAVFAKRRGST